MKAGFQTPEPATVRNQKAADASMARVHRELLRLREENRLLRDSACVFGELAERLAAQLRKVRTSRKRGTRKQARR